MTLNLSKLIRIVEDLLKQNEKLVEAIDEAMDTIKRAHGNCDPTFSKCYSALMANAALLERIAGDEK